jgi:hypothetical protein
MDVVDLLQFAMIAAMAFSVLLDRRIHNRHHAEEEIDCLLNQLLDTDND